MDALGAHRAQIREFFDRSQGGRKYKVSLLTVPPPGRIILDIAEIRRFNKDLSNALQYSTTSLLPAFEEIAQEYAHSAVRIGITGVLAGEKTTPRNLLSSSLGHLVAIEGIVTSTSKIRPKIKKSVHFIKNTLSFLYKEYRDNNTLSILPPTTTAIPKMSADGNPLEMEYGHSEYTSHQSIILQEMPELSPPGQMPRGIRIILEDDLAGAVKPGDRVRVYGTYKCTSQLKTTQDTLKTVLIANNLGVLNKNSKKFASTNENAKNTMNTKSENNENIENETESVQNTSAGNRIKEVLHNEGLDGVVKYIAPSIFGLPTVKKAILLMMIGGESISTTAGGHIRGDINVLLVGDPGVAKSQILRYVLDASPLAICTTGRGASGVGLTAAVVTDEDGGRRIEAGAMVMADTGIVCIDEFDKMDESERVAIHEAMEQQTVTIAKAGIYATLNARCSVLAAANPVSGQYRSTLSPRENIKLPESLLTRFDLIFVLEDKIDFDFEIATHVLERRMGRNRMSDISQEDVREYVNECRQINTVIGEGVAEYVEKEYVRLREEGEKNRLSLSRGVTVRVLESIIRLSTAHARGRLSSVVEVSDAEAAVEIVESTLWRKSVRKKVGKQETSETVCAVLYKYREDNPNDKIVSVEKVLMLTGGEREEVLEGLKELEKEDVIKITNGMIIFP
ncbi:DNA replication licensing factor MCM3 [Nematocida minor]|uniref:DNA replication licensing factor MCM3 n=1 Tax=Nematocida minor TaxID=1912983 RepID=UPI00221FB43D|nr:DNA replication licensing factor MCM3 [Nematocida minor]KAI5192370.1 DNA replication licensing factor MCM3 [Nematocida minor]